MANASGAKRYQCGCASPEAQAYLDAARQALDPTLLRRKGELVLPCTGPETVAAVGALCERFYASPTFDTVPALVAALRSVEREMPTLLDDLPVAVVVREMELVAVGGAQAAVRVIRDGASREIFCPRGPGAALRATPVDQAANRQPLYAASWRLTGGDVVVAGLDAVLQRAGDAALRRIVGRARSALGAARAIARAGRTRRDQAAPVAVIYGAGLSPVPEMPPRPGVKQADKPAEIKRLRHGRSPIWTALLMAVAAIGLVIWLRRPDLSRDNVTRWIELMLMPAPTPTIPMQATGAPSATPEPPFAAPLLVSPKSDDMVLTREVTLRWNWDGSLDADQAFDVRVWRAGTAERSVSVTRELWHTTRLTDVGWYEWTVGVVRLEGGGKVEALSPRAEAAQFFWRADD